MMIRGIHHTGINVRDMDRMLRFYTEGLGFSPVGDAFAWAHSPELDHIVDVPDSAARGIMLRAGTCYLELFQYAAPEPESTRPLRPYDHGYTHICIDVTDIANDIAHLKAAGMTFNEREFVDMGHVRTLYGYDPEGHLIEVQQCAPDNGMTLEDLSR
jgi:glyoxylase I family protein